MSATPHLARSLTFRDLRAGLEEARAQGLVAEHVGADGLRLYIYTRACVYDRAWTPFSLIARGLILDLAAERVVATPFPKFFNVGERDTDTIPALPFETFEKLDGSLIVIFWHDGEWRTATKGSLSSDQATWAARQLAGADLSPLVKGTTYLAEAIYPENRIVVRYDSAGLVMLAAYDEGGRELPADTIAETAAALGWRWAGRYPYATVAELVQDAKRLSANEEGFVIRFANGLRLKVKGDEYRRIHALVSRVTPLAVWESMQAGDDMAAIRRDLPEEFWTDFDNISRLLRANVDALISTVAAEAGAVADWSDKDVGLNLAKFPESVRSLIFPYRKSGGDLLGGRTRQAVFRQLRPTRNELPGYAPSSAVRRLEEETA